MPPDEPPVAAAMREAGLAAEYDRLQQAKQASLAAVVVKKELSCDVEALWSIIGKFDDLSWTGDDPWTFDGKTRALEAYGMKEELLSRSSPETELKATALDAGSQHTMTYKMLEGPFTNFCVTLSAEASSTGGSVAIYAASGELDEEQQGMVREGAVEALNGVEARLAKA